MKDRKQELAVKMYWLAMIQGLSLETTKWIAEVSRDKYWRMLKDVQSN